MIKEIVNHSKIKLLANFWIVVLVAFFCFKIVVASNSWQVVGSSDFSPAWAEYISMSTNLKNTPYVSFRDAFNGDRATVMKYDGSKWVTVGNAGFSSNKINDNSLVFDLNNIPHLVFREQSTDKIIVMKFNGSTWQNMGSVGSSNAGSWVPVLAFDSNNVPYVAFKDDANGNKVTVSKLDFSKNKWVTVGNAGFSPSWSFYVSMTIDKNNIIYVGFSDSNNNWGPTVMKYDGSKWVSFGTNLSTKQSSVNVITLDSNQVPYMAYRDKANGDAITVVKYNGSSWAVVGSAGFGSSMSCCGYDDIGFDIDSNNVPYVAFVDSFNKNKVTVMNYDGTSWKVVGTAGFTKVVNRVSLSIDSNNVLYVAVEDASSHKSTVMRYEKDTGLWKRAGNNGSSSHNSEVVSMANDFDNIKYLAFTDSDQNDKATVIKYDGLNSWTRVGFAGFTKSRADWVSLAFDRYYTPYIAFSDLANPDIGNIGKASVMRYLGGPVGWVKVGNLGFSSAGAEYTRLALDKNDIPYVVFVDNEPGLNNRLTVMKYDGSRWVTVGLAGFTSDTAWYPYIIFDNLNNPYVAYREQSTGKATVMKYDGRKWVTVGPAGFTVGTIDYPQIKFDSYNNIYISFQDWANSGKTTVMKYDGIAAWLPVGTPGITRDQSYGSSLAIYNNVPYISYSYVSATSGNTLDGTGVMKFNGTDWVSVGEEIMDGPTYYTNMLIDKIGTPYVSSVDANGDISIMKFEK